MDKIFIRGLRLEAMIGIYRRERTTSQPVEINLEIALPSAQVFATHKVADTIDYAAVTRRLSEELGRQRFGLVEELAERIATILLEEFNSPWTRVSVAKAGILKEAASVGVIIEREKRRSTP